MALKKTYTTRLAVDGDYWRIDDAQAQFKNSRYKILISLYRDSAAFFAGAEPLCVGHCYIPIPDTGDLMSRDIAYEALKTKNIFIEEKNVYGLLADAETVD